MSYYNNQSGRSMVEILGVLAIIGVLSIGGIAGYSKAMEKFNLHKLVTDVHLIIQKKNTLYDRQKDYGELDNTKAIDFGIVPEHMIVDRITLRSAVGGDVIIKSVDKNKTFVMVFNGLDKQACTTLASIDWGADSAGLAYFVISPTGINTPRGSPGNLDTGEYAAKDLPISMGEVAAMCNCNVQFKCGIAWFYK
jgi:Tfp pilus assembly protein PilE